jgi:hypothetical protein
MAACPAAGVVSVRVPHFCLWAFSEAGTGRR